MQVTEWLATGLGRDIWNRKYRYDNETFDEWLDRVSGSNEDVKRLIIEKKFLFGGRILANRGLQHLGRKISFSNCFLPNQKVLTDKGYKNIQDICVGDKVLTHTNKYQTVNAVLQRDYQGEIYIITPRYGTGTVKCTPNHEFLTNRGWVRAEDLRVKSDNHAVRNGLRYDLIKIINPSDCTVDKKVFDLASISYDFNVEYDKDTISTTGIYKCGNNAKIKITSKKVKRYITIDKNLSYVIGRWLGDGCISSKKNQKLSIVQITFSKNEMSEVIKCKDILFEHFGLEFHIYENKKQNTIILRKENVILANALLKIFGRNVNDKRIPDIFFTKSDLSKSLLLGLIDSDGTFTKDGYIKLLSKNPQLVQQIAELSFVCGFPCNIKEVTQSYKKYKGYLISWSRLVSQNLKDNLNKYYKDNRLQQKYNVNNSIAIKTINGDYYTQIKSVKKEYYSGKVYNLSVEIDNSYNVNGLVVHNCYVITPPEDNIESIFDCAKKLARTYSYGGGCGIDISKLSPRNAKINNAAKETSGSVSFMDLYSLVTQLIGQQGRRGALMISLDCTHPDIEEFINIKSDLNKVTKANISVRITKDFMDAVKNNSNWILTYTRKETGERIEKIVNARELFRKLAKMNWDYAEPGILNWDRITNWNLLSEDENFKYAGVNPCVSGDTLILTDKGYHRIDSLIDKNINIWNGYQFSKVTPKITGYNQKMKKISFSDGSELTCTHYHKFILKNNNRVEAKDLKVGDKLIKCDFPVIESGNSINHKLAYTQGFFMGDGSSESNRDRLSIKLYGEKRKVVDRLTFTNINYCSSFDGEFLTLSYLPNIYNKEFVPNVDYAIESRLNWLAGYIDSDGTLNSNDGSIAISSIKKDVLVKVKQLLNTLGCSATVSKMYKETKRLLPLNDGSNNKELFNCQQSYRIVINATNIKKLMDLGLKTSRVELKANPNRNASRFISVTKIEDTNDCETVYCFNEPLNHSGVFNGVITAQCAEEPLPAGGSCLLGSINLSKFVINPFTKDAKFNFNDFKDTVRLGVFALNEVLHEGLPLHPLQEQKESVNNWRQIGLGILGWHDALIKLGIRYGDQKSLKLANRIGFDMIDTAISYSAQLTDRYGTYPMFNYNYISQSKFFIENTSESTKEIVKQKGLANSQLLTIAPTGSIGTMLGVSTGIEPIYEFSYTRKTESLYGKDEYYKVYTPIVKEYISLKNSNKLPDYFNTAMTLNYKERIEMQSVWQKYIDASISSTVNVPTDFSVEEVEDLYKLAWKKGLKGVTIYRSGCKRDGILKSDNMDNIEENILVWGTTIESSDDLIGKKRKIMSGCGSIHIVAFFDFADGKLMEIFLNKGSQGGCNSWMTSNSRTISAALRTGTSFEYLMDQLKSAPACPSYVTRTAIKKDTSKGHCCPAAVANALEEMQNEVFDELGIFEEEEREKIRKIIVNQCPECGEELKFEGGCNSCSNCGYSKCD